MENIENLKKNIGNVFKNNEKFDLSENHLDEIINSINALIGKPELYEKMEELKNNNQSEFQLLCYFLPDEYLEYYYNREYGMFLADATEINDLKENDFSMTNFLKECRPSQGKSIYETTEKILDDQL